MLEVCVLHWHISPLRDQRFLDAWLPAAEKATAYGCKSWSLTRVVDDPLSFRQSMFWENRSEFERYWYSTEIGEYREKILNWYVIPLVPEWNAVIAAASNVRGIPSASVPSGV